MIRKFSILSIFVIATLLSVSVTAFGQTAPVAGKIMLKKADGSMTPVEGIMVEVFRSDIKSSGPATKTNKKGEFSFAGLQIGGEYIISVSGPGISPTYLPGVKPGNEKVDFSVTEGDGRRLTPEEVRQAAAGAGSGGQQMSEEDKKAQAEFEAKKKEVESKNAQIEKETTIIKASLTDGNAAFQSKNYDVAIAKYDEGINANPTFAGSAPVLLNNRGVALRMRAVDSYNKNVKNSDETAKAQEMAKAGADLAMSVDSFNNSFNILKAAQATDFTTPQLRDEQTMTALNGAKETFRIMGKTRLVDASKLDIAKTMIPEYVAKETDAAKKSEAFTVLGDMHQAAGDADSAIAEYRKALELSNTNADALAGLGLSLVSAGAVAKDEGDSKKDKALSDKGMAQMQEGLNVLTSFAQVAPDTHTLKASVLEAINYLKKEGLTPQKMSTPPARKRN